MDLTGYGYRRNVLRQEVAKVTTEAATTASHPSARLSGGALRLLVKLDTKVSLNELSAQFPRVLNRIADVWSKSQQVDRCFEELLLHSRGVRQGFPQAVIHEIASLRHYYLTHVSPKLADPWEQTMMR